MELTNNIKAKVFVQYLGREFVHYTDNGRETFVGTVTGVDVFTTAALQCGLKTFSLCADIKLILKPLSQITDEHAVEVAKMMGYDNFTEIVRDKNGNFLFVCGNTSGKKVIFAVGPSINLLENNTLWWDDNDGSDGHPGNDGEVSLACYQYLQNQGYDIPHYLLGNKTLHQAGLAIYE